MSNAKRLNLDTTRASDKYTCWITIVTSVVLCLCTQVSELKPLEDLKNLTRLNIGGTKINDQSLSFLNRLPLLTKLNLHQTRVTDKGLSYLRGEWESRIQFTFVLVNAWGWGKLMINCFYVCFPTSYTRLSELRRDKEIIYMKWLAKSTFNYHSVPQ